MAYFEYVLNVTLDFSLGKEWVHQIMQISQMVIHFILCSQNQIHEERHQSYQTTLQALGSGSSQILILLEGLLFHFWQQRLPVSCFQKMSVKDLGLNDHHLSAGHSFKERCSPEKTQLVQEQLSYFSWRSLILW